MLSKSGPSGTKSFAKTRDKNTSLHEINLILLKEFIMNKLSDSVILPREDFLELQAVAFDNTYNPTLGERVAQTLQTAGIFGSMAAAVVVGSWGWAKAMEWREQKQHERFLAKVQFDIDNNLNKIDIP